MTPHPTHPVEISRSGKRHLFFQFTCHARQGEPKEIRLTFAVERLPEASLSRELTRSAADEPNQLIWDIATFENDCVKATNCALAAHNLDPLSDAEINGLNETLHRVISGPPRPKGVQAYPPGKFTVDRHAEGQGLAQHFVVTITHQDFPAVKWQRKFPSTMYRTFLERAVGAFADSVHLGLLRLSKQPIDPADWAKLYTEMRDALAVALLTREWTVWGAYSFDSGDHLTVRIRDGLAGEWDREVSFKRLRTAEGSIKVASNMAMSIWRNSLPTKSPMSVADMYLLKIEIEGELEAFRPYLPRL